MSPTPSSCVWLFLPPLLTNNYHAEIGIPELTANLRASGRRVRQRDLNVELTYSFLTRGEKLCQIARSLAPYASGSGTPVTRWMRAIVRWAGASGAGRAIGDRDLPTFLEHERRRTNRSHLPLRTWVEARPPSVPEDVSRWPEHERAAAREFVGLCASDPSLWPAFVEALQYLAFAPRSFDVGDVFEAAGRRLPLLDEFYAEVLGELEKADGAPDIVGVSLHGVDQMLPAFALLAEVRRRYPRALRVAGGAWCSAARELFAQAPALFDHLDGIVVGQGEVPLQELCARRERGEPLECIPGLAIGVSDGEGARRVEQRPAAPPVPVESLELPHFDDLPLELYPHARLPLRLHEGCAWGRCRFCYHVFPGIHRTGAPPAPEAHLDRIVEHVTHLCRDLGISWYTLLDHAVPFRTLEGFARRVVEAKLDIRWDSMARFEPGLRKETAELLRASGATSIFLGVETMDAKGLRRLRKGITPEMIESGLDAFAGTGLVVRVFLLNYPGQAFEELEHSVEWSLSKFPALLDAMLNRFSLARGTTSWEHRKELGLDVTEAGEPNLDVFQVPFRAEGDVPFEKYMEYWSLAEAKFERLRTVSSAPKSTEPVTDLLHPAHPLVAFRRALGSDALTGRKTLRGWRIESATERGDGARVCLTRDGEKLDVLLVPAGEELRVHARTPVGGLIFVHPDEPGRRLGEEARALARHLTTLLSGARPGDAGA